MALRHYARLVGGWIPSVGPDLLSDPAVREHPLGDVAGVPRESVQYVVQLARVAVATIDRLGFTT